MKLRPRRAYGLLCLEVTMNSQGFLSDRRSWQTAIDVAHELRDASAYRALPSGEQDQRPRAPRRRRRGKATAELPIGRLTDRRCALSAWGEVVITWSRRRRADTAASRALRRPRPPRRRRSALAQGAPGALDSGGESPPRRGCASWSTPAARAASGGTGRSRGWNIARPRFFRAAAGS